jgi:hypothetical protein
VQEAIKIASSDVMTLLIPRLAAPGIGGAQQLTVIIGRSYQFMMLLIYLFSS